MSVTELSMYEPNMNIQNSNFEVTLQLLPLILSNSISLSICSLKNQDQSTLDELGCISTAQHLPIMFTVLNLILKNKNYCFKINNFKISKSWAGITCSALAGKDSRGSRVLGHPQSQLRPISNIHTLLGEKKKLSVYSLFVSLEKFMI